jgi:hypothetical protein
MSVSCWLSKRKRQEDDDDDDQSNDYEHTELHIRSDSQKEAVGYESMVPRKTQESKFHGCIKENVKKRFFNQTRKKKVNRQHR